LRYDNPNAAYAPTGTPAATPQYNGNISQAIWQVRGREKQVYTFQYDFLNRMTEANYAEINTAGARTNDQNKYMEKLTYDLRGNIKTLKRNGLNTTSCTVGLIDDLTYYYADDTNISYSPGNRLKKVFDTSDKDRGFKTQPGNTSLTNAAFLYTYDANGNLKTDPNKKITNITYNHLNLPTLITFGTSPSANTIEFLYDGGGTKLKKTVKQGTTVQYIQDYVGGIEYRTDASNVRTLEAIYHSEGRITNITGSLKYEYALRDHLGNTRLMFSDKNNDGVIKQSLTQETITSEVTQENHYYPFGLAMEGTWANTPSVSDNKYQYNGKELNSDFGLELMDYGARFYDAALGRWHSVDPMAEAAPHLTPYRYCFNNPINFIDPNGMFEGTVSGNKYRDKNESYDGVRAMANAAADREQNKKEMDDLIAKAFENTPPVPLVYNANPIYGTTGEDIRKKLEDVIAYESKNSLDGTFNLGTYFQGFSNGTTNFSLNDGSTMTITNSPTDQVVDLRNITTWGQAGPQMLQQVVVNAGGITNPNVNNNSNFMYNVLTDVNSRNGNPVFTITENKRFVFGTVPVIGSYYGGKLRETVNEGFRVGEWWATRGVDFGRPNTRTVPIGWRYPSPTPRPVVVRP
jgi:RHS repeat-associated protein